jgi:hypothetical protein
MDGGGGLKKGVGGGESGNDSEEDDEDGDGDGGTVDDGCVGGRGCGWHWLGWIERPGIRSRDQKCSIWSGDGESWYMRSTVIVVGLRRTSERFLIDRQQHWLIVGFFWAADDEKSDCLVVQKSLIPIVSRL